MTAPRERFYAALRSLVPPVDAMLVTDAQPDDTPESERETRPYRLQLDGALVELDNAFGNLVPPIVTVHLRPAENGVLFCRYRLNVWPDSDQPHIIAPRLVHDSEIAARADDLEKLADELVAAVDAEMDAIAAGPAVESGA